MPTLLVIDDNPSVGTALELLFSLHDIDVLRAETPEAGLELLQRGGIDLVIQDMNFHADTTSGDEGVALFGQIRAAHPDMPVILLTAWTRLESAVDLVKAGAADYLAKPCDPPDLLMEVSRILFETANAGHVAAVAPSRRRLVVAESDSALRQTLEVEFTQAGFEVKTVGTGPEALESCVTLRPHALVMRLELAEMSADEVVAMLRRLPTTRKTQAVVYGMDLPEAQLEHVANLDIPQNCMLKDLTVNIIIDRTMAVTGA